MDEEGREAEDTRRVEREGGGGYIGEK